MTAFYNEIDPYAAQWLRNLIDANLIADGVVDERSIEDIHPDELIGYTQCHFFAGIGIWSLALRQAGWPDDKPVWTGSCPCQPFSSAGKGAGFSDERHLWPAWYHLITQCQPEHIFGEQVASRDGLTWIDLVQTDLEEAGYANAAVDLCAAGIGAPHIRQRLWLVAQRMDNTKHKGLEGHAWNGNNQKGWQGKDRPSTKGGVSGRLADTCSEPSKRDTRGVLREEAQISGKRQQNGGFTDRYKHGSQDGRLADTQLHGSHRTEADTTEPFSDRKDGIVFKRSDAMAERESIPGATNGLWRDADWLFCRDGKWRPVESGTFPLAHGSASRVGRLRAYGNAINAEAAKIFIEAFM